MPTFQFYKDGKQVHSITGASADKIKDAIEQYGANLTSEDF